MFVTLIHNLTIHNYITYYNHITQFHITVKILTISRYPHCRSAHSSLGKSKTRFDIRWRHNLCYNLSNLPKKAARGKDNQNVCLLKPPARQNFFHHIIHIHDDTLHMLHLITHVTNYVIRVMCRHECV